MSLNFNRILICNKELNLFIATNIIYQMILSKVVSILQYKSINSKLVFNDIHTGNDTISMYKEMLRSSRPDPLTKI